MKSTVWLLAAALVFGGVFAVQFRMIGELRSDLAAVRAELQGSSEPGAAPQSPDRSGNRSDLAQRAAVGGLSQRLAQLERSVADMARTTDFLVERGMVPPSEDRLASMQQRFFDPAAPDGDRLRALRMLRRNQGITDELAVQALSWLQTSTNANTRRSILQQLDGVTNASMKGPLLGLLQTETTGNVREELVDVLSDFADDPAVGNKLWELAFNDPDGEVREEAQEAITRGRMTPERVEQLRQRAASPDASLDERLVALRGLREADVQAPEIINDMATLAQNSTDPVERAKLFQAFDGINDPSLMTPLVYGLQDPNPVVREEAVDALSTFSSDPRIQEWLNHVIQNDADPRVKREAHQALVQSQRGERGDRDRGGRGRRD